MHMQALLRLSCHATNAARRMLKRLVETEGMTEAETRAAAAAREAVMRRMANVKEHCGLVIAQDLDETGFDGMPRSAIMTGGVDLVLPGAKIPEALAQYRPANRPRAGCFRPHPADRDNGLRAQNHRSSAHENRR